MLKKIFVILLFLLSIHKLSYARFEHIVKEVDQFFNVGNGYVVTVDNGNLIVDLTKQKGSYVGKEFKVYREDVEIKHPITGAVLGKRKYYIATIKIVETHDTYSVGKVIDKKGDIKPGDLVTQTLPIKVNLFLSNFDKRLELLMREDLSKSQNLSISKDKSDTILHFNQDEKGGISLDIVVSNEKIKSYYFSDVKLSSLKAVTSDILKSKSLPYEFRTMAVGKIFKDDFDYIAVAEKKFVHFYKFTGKDFEYFAKIDKKFDDIISIELSDLNNNGVDEIFITTIEDETYVNTYIYEYDGKGFKLLKNNLPYVTRSLYDSGIQKLVVQRLSRDGSFVGNIHYLQYNSGNYEKGEAIPYTAGLSIFGFGHADADGDKNKETFQIDSNAKLVIYRNGKPFFESNEFFGETPYEFTLKEEQKSTKSGNQLSSILNRGQSAEDVVNYLTRKKKLTGRVFITTDKNIFLVKNNQLSKTLPNLQAYESASIAGYTFSDKLLRKTWESDNFDPIISDYYLIERYSKKYMYLLRVDRGGLLKGASSEIIYIEIK